MVWFGNLDFFFFYLYLFLSFPLDIYCMPLLASCIKGDDAHILRLVIYKSFNSATAPLPCPVLRAKHTVKNNIGMVPILMDLSNQSERLTYLCDEW